LGVGYLEVGGRQLRDPVGANELPAGDASARLGVRYPSHELSVRASRS